MSNYNRGLNGRFGDWWRRKRKKLLGLLALAIPGPVGLLIAAVVQFLPDDQVKSSFTQFSPRVEALLDKWYDSRFEAWYINKSKVFKNKPSLSALTSDLAISQFNRILVEMASLLKYYEYKATQTGVDTELYNAKAIVMQDALTEFAELYESAVKELKGTIYINRKDVKTITVNNGPDVTNWKGKSFTIKVPSFSKIPNTKPLFGDPIFIKPSPEESNIILPPVEDFTLPPEISVSDRPIKDIIPVNCFNPPCNQGKPLQHDKPTQRPKPKDTTKPMVVHQTVTPEDMREEDPKESKSKNGLLKLAGAAIVTGILVKTLS